MAIIPWRPFDDLERFFDEDWFLPSFQPVRVTSPAMDIYETDKEVIAEVNLPGIDPEKVEVSVKDQILTVSGKSEEKKEEKEKGYWRREIRKGSFERMVRLPVSVKEDEVEATYEKGVLKIVMPKAELKKEKGVKIKVKGK
jgi:HSP20 family protein